MGRKLFASVIALAACLFAMDRCPAAEKKPEPKKITIEDDLSGTVPGDWQAVEPRPPPTVSSKARQGKRQPRRERMRSIRLGACQPSLSLAGSLRGGAPQKPFPFVFTRIRHRYMSAVM